MSTIENQTINKEIRNYGIDLLRILITIMVIILHLLVYGGLQEHAVQFTGSYNLLWFLAIAADCAVNCFALISGFVAYEKEFHFTNILRLHLTVLFHGFVITWIIRCISPESVSDYDIIRSVLPISLNTYWYYSIYAVLFFLIPLLNWIVKKTSKRYGNIIILVAVFLFSIIPTVTGRDYFAVNGGFSLPWLTLLCFIGMFLKKYYDELCHNISSLTAIYFGCISITWILKLALELLSWISYGTNMDTSMLIDYCSPTILFASIALVLLFASLKIPAWKIKMLSYMAPLTFSVYIIHEHPLIRHLLIRDSMLFVIELPPIVQMVIVIFASVLIWLVCSGFDWIRKAIFDVLHIEKCLRSLEKKTHMCGKYD